MKTKFFGTLLSLVPRTRNCDVPNEREVIHRRVRAHKLTMEALFRLMWQAFLHWLNGKDQCSLKANVDGKHLEDGMKSFHLAQTSKRNVSQGAESITDELKTVMELFETFGQAERV